MKIKRKKKFSPINQGYYGDNTASVELKKKLPSFYNNYLNQTKKTFTNLNNTYSEIKNDITYDIVYDLKPNLKKKAFTEKELKYEEMNNDVKEMKRDIGYKKPSIELFTDKSTSFQFLTGKFDSLNKINSNIVYKNRFYLAKKYGIDIKKDLYKIEIDNEDHLYKFRKHIPK